MAADIYILASRKGGTIYIGATSNLVSRVYQHRIGAVEGFTKKYGVHTLVWYEIHRSIQAAITREKQLKGWNRAWKIRLIERNNSGWNDLCTRMRGEIALPDLLPSRP